VVVFGFTFVALGLVSDGLYALAAGTLAAWLGARRRVVKYASGSVFVGLGISAALAKRS
jgi:threonine/homoserine/homoserine lactone efflux protein